MSTTPRLSGFLLLVLVCLYPTLPFLDRLAAAQSAQGLVEKAGAPARPRLSAGVIQSFVPGWRGVFQFPPPYNTKGYRLTEPSDCPKGNDCLLNVGYSYWRNISNHLSRNLMYVVLTFDKAQGGAGPTLFAVDKSSDAITKLGPLFEESSPFSWASGEGWYFSGSHPSKLYVNDGARLLRYDVVARHFEVVFDAASAYGADKYVWQTHSSNDDQFHSATLRSRTTDEMLGCLYYREDLGQFSFFQKIGAFDECHLDKSGRWLVSLENIDGQYDVDMRVFDMSVGVETARILDQDGAPGHLDMGYGYMVAADDWHAMPNAAVTWRLDSAPVKGPAVFYNRDWTVSAANHLSHGNARPDVPMEKQYACGSDADRVPNAANEVVCFRLDGSRDVLVVAPVMTDLDASGGGTDSYAKAPKGNLDVSGEYFIWTTNLGGGRLDAFLVKVPSNRLFGG